MNDEAAASDRPKPAAIAVAPNGGRRTKSDHPALPLTASEITYAASRCLEAGAAMIHMHVRDREGAHLLDADAYRKAIAATKNAVGDRLLIQITTESLGRYRPREQMDVVKAVRPEAASLALRELAPTSEEEAEFSEFLIWMAKEAIAPQFILYEPEEAERLAAMHRSGMVPLDRFSVLYVLGRYSSGQTSAPQDLLPFLAPASPRFPHWMVCAFGRRETACAAFGALLGGDARVGFENNLLLPDGALAQDNAALVAAAVQAVRSVGIETADADLLRELWGISP
jgi:3-keto-5-aminohexanoate cleavage enzyme